MKRMLLAAFALLLIMIPAHAATFADTNGREVTLSGTPGRVVALLGSYGKVWQEAGGTLVGTTEDAIDPASDDIANLGSHSQHILLHGNVAGLHGHDEDIHWDHRSR